MTVFTISQILKLAPDCADVYAAAFAAPDANITLAQYSINNNPLRLCHFFAQILEETGRFRATVENLSYSAERMMQVWPSRFPTFADAEPYANNPEKLANHVYAGRLGNNAPGDGYKYRGRGLLQTTGKAAYKRYGDLIGADLVSNPDLAVDSRYCLQIAAAEYAASGYHGKYCNDWADLDDIKAVTLAVNGGLTNLDQRIQALAECKAFWMPEATASVAASRAAAAAAARQAFEPPPGPTPPCPEGAAHDYVKTRAIEAALSARVCTPYFKVRLEVAVAARASPARGARRTWDLGDLCKAYAWPAGATGSGVIAIVELGGGYADTDIRDFCTGAGIPLPNVQSVSVHPGAVNNPGTATGRDDDPDIEVTMDIEVAAAAYSIATGQPAQIRMYWALNQPGGIADAVRKATADGCDVCSISWGADESMWRSWAADGGRQYVDDMEQAAAAAVVAGMVVFAASGDNNANDGGPNPANVDLPSSSPSVVGCGGTTKTKENEVVWNNAPHQPDGDGTGGGFSDAFPRPAWQFGAPSDQLDPGGSPMRMVPDIAANADPKTGYNLIIHGVEDAFGGTSAVAPLYSGLFAAFGTKLGFVTDRLWRNPACFVDVTEGENGLYSAGPGPDPCSGLGVPIGTALAALFSDQAPVAVAPAAFAAAPAAELARTPPVAVAARSPNSARASAALAARGPLVSQPRAANGFDPQDALVYGQLIDQAYAMFLANPTDLTPSPGPEFPATHRLTAWVQMQDFVIGGVGPVFYGFIAQSVADPARSVLALRGTEGLLEWFDDTTSILRVPFRDYTDCGTVSYGFARIYETLRLVEAPGPGVSATLRATPRALSHVGGFAAQVAAHVRATRSVSLEHADGAAQSVIDIVGHSLGAALATLYALENARTAKLQTSLLYAFACPMVGDATFAAAFNRLGLTSWRIVNAQDWVPKLPSAFFGYAHIDSEQRYDSTGMVQPNEDCFHAMATYLHLIDPTLPVSSGCGLS